MRLCRGGQASYWIKIYRFDAHSKGLKEGLRIISFNACLAFCRVSLKTWVIWGKFGQECSCRSRLDSARPLLNGFLMFPSHIATNLRRELGIWIFFLKELCCGLSFNKLERIMFVFSSLASYGRSRNLSEAQITFFVFFSLLNILFFYIINIDNSFGSQACRRCQVDLLLKDIDKVT